jgi:2-methylcitrate dehydratase
VTQEDPYWTKRYHSTDPDELAFGGRVEITLTDGTKIVDEIAVADAHPRGARPFGKADYERKFRTLAEYALEASEMDRFIAQAHALPELTVDQVRELNVVAKPGIIKLNLTEGIF